MICCKAISILLLMLIPWLEAVITEPTNQGGLQGPKAQARRDTFDRFDHDGDGKWRKRDLAKRLGEFGAGKSIGKIKLDGMVGKAASLVVSKGLMTKFDVDKDGRMNYQEYGQMLTKWDTVVPDMVKSSLKKFG